ncbi:MAG TPA: hypothetical protein PLL20_21495 [Phycisphaerae bacterium]|nr:hypothetical protein [Phycisphaerae bacterium]
MSKPEKVFKMGAVRASIFVNTIDRGGQAVSLPKVIIEVRYKDKAGQWQGTNSLSVNDLPKAIAALQKAYDYLLGSETEDLPGPELQPASSPQPIRYSRTVHKMYRSPEIP